MLSLPLETWSESFWTMIETMIIRFDATNRIWISDVKNFFLILPRLLPCQQCATHLVRYNYEHPLMSNIDSPLHFFIWVYQLRKSMGYKYSEVEYIQYMHSKFNVSPQALMDAFQSHGEATTRKFLSNVSSTRPRKPCNCGKK